MSDNYNPQDHPALGKQHPSAFTEHDIYSLHFAVERHWLGLVKGRVSVHDMLTVSFDDVDGTYMVYNSDGSPSWTSVHKDRNTAILLYLQRRLGIAEKDEEHSDERA